MHSLTLGQYYHCNSVIHRLDPRTKILTLIPMLIVLTMRQTGAVVGILAGMLVFVLLLSRIPVQIVVKQMKFFLWLAVLTIIVHSFTTPGTVIYTIPFVKSTLSREGVINGLYFGLRLLLMVAFSVIVLLTTAPADLTDGVEKLLRPLRRIGIKADAVGLVFSIAMRFVPVLYEEGERIRLAQMARGAQFDGPVRVRLKAVASLVIPLFISVFKRAEALSYALQARGYPGSGNRTYYRDARFALSDGAAFFIVVTVAAVALWRFD